MHTGGKEDKSGISIGEAQWGVRAITLEQWLSLGCKMLPWQGEPLKFQWFVQWKKL